MKSFHFDFLTAILLDHVQLFDSHNHLQQHSNENTTLADD